MFWKFIQCIVYWEKTTNVKKISSDRINVTKNPLFFLSGAPTHHILTLNSWYIYELKHKAHLSKSVCGIFHFLFRLVLLNFIFLFNIILFKMIPGWFLCCNKKFEISMISVWVRVPQHWPGEERFKLRKSKFWECFSQ